MPDQDKHNHHQIPQHYLRGFAADDGAGLIWVYEKGRSYKPGYNPCKVSIKKHAGNEKDYYAFSDESGKTDFNSIENKLEKKEKPSNSIFRKLRNQQIISADEKEEFAKYLTMMVTRVPKFEDWLDKNLEHDYPKHNPEVVAEHIRQIEAEILDANPEEIESLLCLKKKLTLWRKIGGDINGPLPRQVSRLTMADTSNKMSQHIAQMTWSYLLAPRGELFITSDNPVFISDDLCVSQNPVIYQCFEVSFPISKEVAISASWDKTRKEGFVEASRNGVHEINRRVACTAHKEVYCSQNLRWVTQLLNKKFHHLNVIVGNL